MAPPVSTPDTKLEPVILPATTTKTVAPAAPVVKLGPSGRPIVEHRDGTPVVSVTPPDDRFILRPGVGIGGFGSKLGAVGGPDGGVFDVGSNSFTENGKWTFVDLSLGLDFRIARLFSDQASLLLGPRIAYQRMSSERSTGGSYMNIGELGLMFGLDWKNSMHTWPVILPSRLAIGGSGVYGSGETTAGNHASIADTRGAGYALRAEADVLGFRLNNSGDSVNLSLAYDTGVIPHARGDANLPWWQFVTAVTVPLVWPGSTRQVTRIDTDVELCRADQSSLETLVEKLKIQQQEALAKYTEFNRLAALLNKKGYTPEKILAALRTGYVKKLEATAADESSAKLEAAVAAALEAKKGDFEKAIAADASLKDDPAKAAKLAELQKAERARVEAEFAKAGDPEMDAAVAKVLEGKKPELEKAVAADKSLKGDAAKAAKLAELTAAEKAKAEAAYRAEKTKAKEVEYLAKAKAVYPDGYNHFKLDLPDVTAFDAGFKIPTDCAGQEGLYDRLLEDRRALDIFLTRVEERTHFMFFALGKPAKTVVDALGGLGFAQFPPLNFVGGQPDYGIKNEGPGKRGPDMDKIEKFLEANKGTRFASNDPKLQTAFKGIFAGNELLALEDVVKQLNGEKEMKGVRARKMKPEEFQALVKKIPILIEAHVSITDGKTDENQILSDNRARAVEIAMTLLGMDASRIKAVGKGESDPIVPETLDWSKTGKRVKNLTWAREKNRRVQFWVDTDKLEAAEAKVEGTVAAPKAPDAPPAAPLPAAPTDTKK